MSRISSKAPYGQHIPLYCKNHPDLRWSTKNIAPIGARTIYFDLMYELPGAIECSCSCKELRPLIDDTTPDVPE